MGATASKGGHMIYTIKEYTQDKKTAEYAFRKYITKHYLKDELIHLGIVKLWLVRLEKGHISRPIETAKNVMLNHIRNQYRHDNHNSLHETDNDDLMLFDILAIEQPTAHDYCEYQDLVKKITPITDYLSERDRRIIRLHLKHYTQREIAHRVQLSLSYVNEIIAKFREAVNRVLGE